MGVKSLPELIDWAKARPGQLTCGTSGHGSGAHFICELLARSATIKLNTVPYKGTGAMLLDTASGQIHITIGFLAEVDKQYVQSYLPQNALHAFLSCRRWPNKGILALT
jgi:tripartite-type tricarboxylate transporter receptor subunit TctC